MNNYNIKLIHRTKLLNFWSFSGNDLKNIFTINYKFIFCVYKNKNLFDFNVFILNFKKIFPIFNTVFFNNGKFLFVGTSYVYSHSIYKIGLVGEIKDRNVGVLTNFSFKGYKTINFLTLNKVPSIILFFHTAESNFLVLESKKNYIPSVGLVNSYNNTCLIDYPIFLNSFYFYNIYIFSRFFFKYIVQLL